MTRHVGGARLVPVVVAAALAVLASGCVVNGSWTATAPIPHVAGAAFESVDCVGATWCIATGQAAGVPAAQTWDGSTWTVRPAPPPGPLGTGTLFGVECMDVDRCLGLAFQPTATAGATYAVFWNGVQWSGVPGSSNRISWGSTERISCFAGGCVVADYDNSGMVRWDGTTFTMMTSASGPPAGAIACVSFDDCLAAGDYDQASHWDGATWTEVPAYTAVSFTQLECPRSTDECIATGYDDFNEPWAGRWDGSGWTLTTRPGSAYTLLTDLSCASAAECLALGVSAVLEDPGSVPVQLAWNGSDWFVAPSPPSAATATYRAVSCVALSCLAVGATDAATPQPVAATYGWTNP